MPRRSSPGALGGLLVVLTVVSALVTDCVAAGPFTFTFSFEVEGKQQDATSMGAALEFYGPDPEVVEFMRKVVTKRMPAGEDDKHAVEDDVSPELDERVKRLDELVTALETWVTDPGRVSPAERYIAFNTLRQEFGYKLAKEHRGCDVPLAIPDQFYARKDETVAVKRGGGGEPDRDEEGSASSGGKETVVGGDEFLEVGDDTASASTSTSSASLRATAEPVEMASSPSSTPDTSLHLLTADGLTALEPSLDPRQRYPDQKRKDVGVCPNCAVAFDAFFKGGDLFRDDVCFDEEFHHAPRPRQLQLLAWGCPITFDVQNLVVTSLVMTRKREGEVEPLGGFQYLGPTIWKLQARHEEEFGPFITPYLEYDDGVDEQYEISTRHDTPDNFFTDPVAFEEFLQTFLFYGKGPHITSKLIQVHMVVNKGAMVFDERIARLLQVWTYVADYLVLHGLRRVYEFADWNGVVSSHQLMTGSLQKRPLYDIGTDYKQGTIGLREGAMTYHNRNLLGLEFRSGWVFNSLTDLFRIVKATFDALHYDDADGQLNWTPLKLTANEVSSELIAAYCHARNAHMTNHNSIKDDSKRLSSPGYVRDYFNQFNRLKAGEEKDGSLEDAAFLSNIPTFFSIDRLLYFLQGGFLGIGRFSSDKSRMMVEMFMSLHDDMYFKGAGLLSEIGPACRNQYSRMSDAKFKEMEGSPAPTMSGALGGRKPPPVPGSKPGTMMTPERPRAPSGPPSKLSQGIFKHSPSPGVSCGIQEPSTKEIKRYNGQPATGMYYRNPHFFPVLKALTAFLDSSITFSQFMSFLY